MTQICGDADFAVFFSKVAIFPHACVRRRNYYHLAKKTANAAQNGDQEAAPASTRPTSNTADSQLNSHTSNTAAKAFSAPAPAQLLLANPISSGLERIHGAPRRTACDSLRHANPADTGR
jgi:hypothetical protein